MSSEISLNEVGFFDSAEAIRKLAGSAEQPWESAAIRYLEGGVVVLVSPGWVDDLLDPEKKSVCQYSVLTDGTWVWPNSLAYYLRNYHLKLPQVLVRHMASNNWSVPEVSEADLDAICEQLAAW